jgi:hypothetical protein
LNLSTYRIFKYEIPFDLYLKFQIATDERINHYLANIIAETMKMNPLYDRRGVITDLKAEYEREVKKKNIIINNTYIPGNNYKRVFEILDKMLVVNELPKRNDLNDFSMHNSKEQSLPYNTTKPDIIPIEDSNINERKCFEVNIGVDPEKETHYGESSFTSDNKYLERIPERHWAALFYILYFSNCKQRISDYETIIESYLKIHNSKFTNYSRKNAANRISKLVNSTNKSIFSKPEVINCYKYFLQVENFEMMKKLEIDYPKVLNSHVIANLQAKK